MIEEWYQATSPASIDQFYSWLCIDTGKVCCPEGTFGKNCRRCQYGDNGRVCSGNGNCDVSDEQEIRSKLDRGDFSRVMGKDRATVVVSVKRSMRVPIAHAVQKVIRNRLAKIMKSCAQVGRSNSSRWSTWAFFSFPVRYWWMPGQLATFAVPSLPVQQYRRSVRMLRYVSLRSVYSYVSAVRLGEPFYHQLPKVSSLAVIILTASVLMYKDLYGLASIVCTMGSVLIVLYAKHLLWAMPVWTA